MYIDYDTKINLKTFTHWSIFFVFFFWIISHIGLSCSIKMYMLNDTGLRPHYKYMCVYTNLANQCQNLGDYLHFVHVREKHNLKGHGSYQLFTHN